jgi:antagonist of KipI
MVEILTAGLYTTIQDIGRFEFQEFGVPVSGAMDKDAMKLANWLVGNSSNNAVLEITLTGPKLKFHQDTRIGLTGANISPTINGVSVEMNKTLIICKGDVLEFGKLIFGCRTYLSFSGGINIQEEMKSRSTYVYAKIGGVIGEPLSKGDRIPLNEFNDFGVKVVPNEFTLKYTTALTVRVISGIEEKLFTRKSLESFYNTEFTISSNSNRMGYRLNGEKLYLKDPVEILSSGIVEGTIQVPQNGNPIVLLADSQTTGGYPRIANVISVDIPFLGQQKPGDKIRFKKVSLEEAQSLLYNKEQRMKKILIAQ